MSIAKDTWRLAAEVLARGGTLQAAADAAGVTKQTVIRWKADEPMFADRVADARSAMIDQASGVLTSATASWAQTLADLAIDAEVAPQFRIAAARAGLDAASRYRQDIELERRLTSLEIQAGLRSEAV